MSIAKKINICYTYGMERYDSTKDTKAHIDLVGKDIDIFCEYLANAEVCTKLTEQSTLVDLACIDEQTSTKVRGSAWAILGNCYMPSDINIRIPCLINQLQMRKAQHDKSKLEEPEKSYFDTLTPKLAGSTYGSEEYKGFLKELEVPLAHHYSVNRHHPEHFSGGINDMDIVDIIEMFCDWHSSTKRHANGCIHTSNEFNQKRFGYCDGLKLLFTNTAKDIFKEPIPPEKQ